MKKENKYLLLLIGLQIIIITSLLIVVIISGKDYQVLLLMDDGYYHLAGLFVRGQSILHKFIGPVLPIILSVLYIFPENSHPILRLIISIICSSGVIIILYHLTRNYLTIKQFFMGALIFLFNPVYIHWAFKSCPENYLTLLLGVFILTFLKFYKTGQYKYLIISIIVFILSIFLKPAFLFIPFLLLGCSFIIKSKKVIIASSVLIIIGFVGYQTYNKITKIEYSTEIKGSEKRVYGKISMIGSSFWIDYLLKTKQFHKGTVIKYKSELNIGTREWIKEYFKKYPGGNYLHMNLYFIYDKPLLFIKKIALSPFFFFSMAARPIETFVYLFFSIISITLSIIGLKSILKKNGIKNDIVIILSILLGFMLLYWVLHSMNRYSMPVLPYLYIWGGIPIINILEKIRLIKLNNVDKR